MMSRVSYFKLMKHNIKQHIWYGAILLLCFFMALPLPAMMMGTEDIWNEEVRNSIQMSQYRCDIIENIQGRTGIIPILIVVAALVGGCIAFSYFHSRKKMDFYGSLPIPRVQLFICDTVSMIVLFSGAFLLNGLLTLIVTGAKKAYTVKILQAAITGFLIGLLFYLVIYMAMVISMMLTGKILTGILGSVVFLGILPAMYMILRAFPQMFYSTYVDKIYNPEILSYLSPVAAYIWILASGNWGKLLPIGEVTGILIFQVVLLIVLTALAIWLIKIRPAEGAEQSIVFPRTEGPIKCILLYMLSLGGGMIFNMFDGGNSVWFWFGIIFTFLVFSIIVEVIYHQDRKQIFGNKIWTGISAIAVLATSSFAVLDLGGYDTWIPQKEKVEYATVIPEHLQYEWFGFDDESNTSYEYVLRHVEEFQNSKAFSIAKTGIENLDNLDDGFAVDVVYQMKNGKTKVRQYKLRKEEYELFYQEFLENPLNRQLEYPILTKKSENVMVDSIEFWNDSESDFIEKLNTQERKELAQIYLKELLEMDQEKLQKIELRKEDSESSLEGTIGLSYEKKGILQANEYRLNEDFIKTMEYLKEKGVLSNMQREEN